MRAAQEVGEGAWEPRGGSLFPWSQIGGGNQGQLHRRGGPQTGVFKPRGLESTEWWADVQVEGITHAKAHRHLQRGPSLQRAQSRTLTHKLARPMGSAAVPPEPPKGVHVWDVSGTLRLSCGAQGCEWGLGAQGGCGHTPHRPLLHPVPVGQSQGLGVGGRDHEADGWGRQLVPRAVREVPALPVVLLQGVAVAPRDQALVGDRSVRTHGQACASWRPGAQSLPNSGTWGVSARLSDPPHDVSS